MTTEKIELLQRFILLNNLQVSVATDCRAHVWDGDGFSAYVEEFVGIGNVYYVELEGFNLMNVESLFRHADICILAQRARPITNPS